MTNVIPFPDRNKVQPEVLTPQERLEQRLALVASEALKKGDKRTARRMEYHIIRLPYSMAIQEEIMAIVKSVEKRRRILWNQLTFH